MERLSYIYWNDLKEEVKEGMARDRKTTPEKLCEEHDFDVVPITSVMI